MPKKETKRFIDKNNSVTFHLVHRSQKDPLTADNSAPQRVLVPITNKITDIQKRKNEQQKYGIYFDDNYDYLKHLKDVNIISDEWNKSNGSNADNNSDLINDKSKINLPSSVFESNVQEKIGLLNKASPFPGLQLDLDPDVIAALDDDFDFENPDNQLEDNFVELANTKDCDNDFDISDDVTDEEEDEAVSLASKYSFEDEETKSRFTNYSISSNVIKRNNQLTLLDGKFETMYASYDENEIGPLNCEEIEGHIEANSDLILQCAEEYKKQVKNVDSVTKDIQNNLNLYDTDDSNSEGIDNCDTEKLLVEIREKNKWDCESILSTYSNIYNHPKLISEPKRDASSETDEPNAPRHPRKATYQLPTAKNLTYGPLKIKIDFKTGMPKNILNGRKANRLTTQNLIQFENKSCMDNKFSNNSTAVKSVASIFSARPKNETPEEKKERKAAVKNHRKERRRQRKANTEAYKELKKREDKVSMNILRTRQENKIF